MKEVLVEEKYVSKEQLLEILNEHIEKMDTESWICEEVVTDSYLLPCRGEEDDKYMYWEYGPYSEIRIRFRSPGKWEKVSDT